MADTSSSHELSRTDSIRAPAPKLQADSECRRGGRLTLEVLCMQDTTFRDRCASLKYKTRTCLRRYDLPNCKAATHESTPRLAERAHGKPVGDSLHEERGMVGGASARSPSQPRRGCAPIGVSQMGRQAEFAGYLARRLEAGAIPPAGACCTASGRDNRAPTSSLQSNTYIRQGRRSEIVSECGSVRATRWVAQGEAAPRPYQNHYDDKKAS